MDLSRRTASFQFEVTPCLATYAHVFTMAPSPTEQLIIKLYLEMHCWLSQSKSVFFKSHQNASLEPIIPNYPLDMNKISLSNKALRVNKSECDGNAEMLGFPPPLSILPNKRNGIQPLSSSGEEEFICGISKIVFRA